MPEAPDAPRVEIVPSESGKPWRKSVANRVLPASAAPGLARLLFARGLRAGADGLVAASLSAFLSAQGFSEAGIGLLVTATLLGSAVVLIVVARFAHKAGPGDILRWCSVLMVFTGAVFATVPWIAVLAAVAAVGPLNPSAGDVSAFLPAEQALLPGLVSEADRTAVFARYNLVGFACGALGAACAGLPLVIGEEVGWGRVSSLSLVFWFYALIGLACVALYAPFGRKRAGVPVARSRLGASRRRVQRLTALFCIDAAAGGLALSSLVAIWLDRRHQFSLAQIGGVLSAMGLLSALSSLAAPRLARRIGLVRTMVFTHLPANALLILAALAPNGPTAVAFLLGRALFSQMDVPARQSYVMSVVLPEERAAAAAYTNIPRSLAAATTPAFAGWMLGNSTFGWPLLICGAMKSVYDLLLLQQFGTVGSERDPAQR